MALSHLLAAAVLLAAALSASAQIVAPVDSRLYAYNATQCAPLSVAAGEQTIGDLSSEQFSAMRWCRLAENGTNSMVGSTFDFGGSYGTRFWGNPNGGPNGGGGQSSEQALPRTGEAGVLVGLSGHVADRMGEGSSARCMQLRPLM